MIKALQPQHLQRMHPAPCVVGIAHCRTLELYSYATLTYAEAMTRFGTDKPDLRYGLELVDISDLVADSGFDVFVNALGAQGQVKGVCAPGCAAYSRRQLDELQEIARGGGARGAMFITIVEKGQLRTSLSRYLGAEQLAAIVGRLGRRAGRPSGRGGRPASGRRGQPR
jgi:aspartyl-tRNA synthetase